MFRAGYYAADHHCGCQRNRRCPECPPNWYRDNRDFSGREDVSAHTDSAGLPSDWDQYEDPIQPPPRVPPRRHSFIPQPPIYQGYGNPSPPLLNSFTRPRAFSRRPGDRSEYSAEFPPYLGFAPPPNRRFSSSQYHPSPPSRGSAELLTPGNVRVLQALHAERKRTSKCQFPNCPNYHRWDRFWRFWLKSNKSGEMCQDCANNRYWGDGVDVPGVPPQPPAQPRGRGFSGWRG